MNLYFSTRRLRLLAVVIPSMALIGCFGEGDGKQRIPGTPQEPLTGLLLDSGLSGVSWASSGTLSGVTNDLGEFQYLQYESVTFSIGDIVLGTAPGAPIITSVELTGSADPTVQPALNQLVFLQSIDSDSDPSNGISISATTLSMAAGVSLDFTSPDFASEVASVVAAITEPDNAVVSESAALLHFYQTYSEIGGTDAVNFLFPGFPPVGDGVAYRLVFSDEFNEGDTPSSENWTIETGYGPRGDGWGNNEWQLYTDSPDNVRVEDGNLVLSALCSSPQCGVRDGTVTSGKINTLDKFNFKFGRVVARIKPPVGTGAWPAFWSLGANYPDIGWPRSGEIDFMEMHYNQSNDRTTHFTIHYCDQTIQAPLPCSFPDGWVFETENEEFDFSLGDDFHVFEAEWDATGITGKIDGITYFERDINPATMDEFLKEFYMILNVAMGGTLGSGGRPPDGSETFPQTMLVDYVRVFQNVSGSDPGDPGNDLSQIDFPITFNEPTVDYTVIDFGDPTPVNTTLILDPTDAENIVASTTKPVGTPVWAGTTMSTEAGLASAIPFSSTATTIGIRVFSPDAGIPVRLKAEVMINVMDGVSVETETMTTVANEWETLVFDFANEVEGAPLDLDAQYRFLSIFFNFGTDGMTAGEKTYLWDDVEFGVLPPVIDETPPTLTNVTLESNNTNTSLAKVGDVVTVAVAADESIVQPTVTIAGVAADTFTGGGPNWQASRTLTAADAEGAVAFSVVATDLAGNTAAPVSMSTDGSVLFDATAPMVDILGAPAEFSTLDPIAVTVQFSEPVMGFDLIDIQATNGTASGLATADGISYTANVTPNGSGDLLLAIAAGAAADLAGNPSLMATGVSILNNLDVDTPLLSLISISSDNDNPNFARAGNVITIDMTATEEILEPTVMISGAMADTVVTGDSGAGLVWVASRTALASDTEQEIAFAINFEDLTGNAGPQSTVTTDGSSVTFDNTAPGLSIVGMPDMVLTVDLIAVTFQFDENVEGFVIGGIDVTNGAASNFDSVDAMTYTADITPDGNGDVVVTVDANAAADFAGNGNAVVSVSGTLDLSPFWQEAWSDEFDGVALNTGNWTIRTTDTDCPAPCSGIQSYLSERVSVGGGRLRIEARNDSAAVYTSGLIDTRGNLEFKHGRIEIDAMMPGTVGSAPSLWMLPAPAGAYGPWPQSGEIDITNAPGLGDGGNTTLEHTLRYGLPAPEDTAATDVSDAPTLATTEFFTYALEWEAGEMRWFVDGVHVATQIQDNWYAYSENADGVYTLGTDAAPFDQDFYVLLSLAVDAGSGAYPQTLEIEAVRVYQCANPADPDAGTGCAGDIDPVDPDIEPVVATPAPYNGAPYTQTLPVYTDAPAMLDFVDEGGATTEGVLVPDTFVSDAAVMVSSNVNADDMGNPVWNVNIAAPAGSGGVLMGPGDFASATGYFDLSGGDTAGEVLFRMRVNSAAGDPQLSVKLDSDTGSGTSTLDYTADGVWRNYSVKLAHLLTNSVVRGSSLDLSNLVNVFALEAATGTVDLDLDNIEVKVACRDDGGCEATPRLRSMVEVQYSQDFEPPDVDLMDPMALSDDPDVISGGAPGYIIFANVFDPSGMYLFGYGPDPAPNAAAPMQINGYSAIVNDQGGVEQGMQQLSVFSDYNNNEAHTAGNLVESLVFRERTVVAADVGKTITFSFDAKKGLIEAPTTANAFVKTINPAAGFSLTRCFEVDTTDIAVDWQRYSLSLPIESDLVGQLLQIGFSNTATSFNPSSNFYDNILVESGAGSAVGDNCVTP